MPKASKKNTTRKHKQSPKKGRAEQTEAAGPSAAGTTAASTSVASTSAASTSTIDAPAANDLSQWRASTLKASDMITKTDAKKQYRLNEEDLKGMSYRKQSTFVSGIETPMFLYWEQDIERKAWEKHGGPEKFDAYIAKLKETYLKKYGSYAHFKQPRTYEDRGPRIDICSLPPPPPGPKDRYILTGSRILWGLKEQMPPWFWTTYNEALWQIDFTGEWGTDTSAPGSGPLFIMDKDREAPLKDALLKMMPTYPPRPPEPLAPSPSVDKVRAVLADAGKLPSHEQFGRHDIPGLTLTIERDMYGAPESWTYDWSNEFLERLFSALIEFVDEYGTGREGFEGIRWEVYDKCVECLKIFPHYDQRRRMWTVDRAAEWLDGQLTSLGDSETGTYRAKCPAGKRYNDLLPRLNPQGARSVGVRPR